MFISKVTGTFCVENVHFFLLHHVKDYVFRCDDLGLKNFLINAKLTFHQFHAKIIDKTVHWHR